MASRNVGISTASDGWAFPCWAMRTASTCRSQHHFFSTKPEPTKTAGRRRELDASDVPLERNVGRVEFTTSRAVQLFAEDVLHRILDLLASLLDVTLGLVALALYLKPRIISDPAGGFLRLALEHLSLVLNLVAGSHTSLPVVGRVETKYPKVILFNPKPTFIVR